MIRTTSKTLAAAVLALSLAACGQAPTGSNPEQVSVSTTETPPPPSTQDNPRDDPTGNNAAVGRDRAVEIALDRTGGGTVDEVENEVEHGRTAWKVRVVKNGIRYSVYIDQANGDIIRFRDEGRD